MNHTSKIHCFTFALIAFGFNCFSQVTTNQEEFSSLFEAGTKPELLAGNFKFAEGLAADAFGNIYLSDIGKDRTHYWDIRSKKNCPFVAENVHLNRSP